MVDEFSALQRRYGNRGALAGRRGAFHPAVEAYVMPRLKWLAQHVPLSGKTSVLDVGSGEGRFAAHLERLCNVVAVDFSEAQLARNPVSKRIRGDVRRLHFGNGVFDLAFAHALLHHVEDPGGGVAEMARVYRRWVVLCEPNRANPMMWAFYAMIPAERKLLGLSKRHLAGWLHQAGLRVVASRTAGFVSANWTPTWLLPVLRSLEGAWPLGVTHMLIAEKG